jgi:hypothetical protein
MEMDFLEKEDSMKRFLWVGLFALALAVAIPAGASTFVGMTQGEMLAESEAVVQGKVLKINSFWSPSGRLIVTEAMIQVEETIVGSAPTVLTVRTAGGLVDGFVVEAHGFPKFAVGERLVLFVRNAQAEAEVVGYRQGQFRISQDTSGAEIAVPTLEKNVRLLSIDGAPVARPSAVRLDTLKEQLRSQADRVRRPLEN